MKSSLFLTLAAAIGAFALPAIDNSAESDYDILLSPFADVDAVLRAVERKTDDARLKKHYNNHKFKGFSGSFTAAEAQKLRAIADVQSVDPQIEITIAATRDGATWGLQRISQADTVSGNAGDQTFTYSFTDASLGEGVDIYMIDTGVLVDHEEFDGRAKMVFSSSDSNTDDNGHGTHTAGTAAGKTVGVASGANVLGVKVLGGDGSGSSADLIAGIDFVVNNHKERSSAGDFVASVASMSLGFQQRSTSVENALKGLSNAGIHMAVASGNSATDTCTSTPGSLGGANGTAIVSVGAASIEDEIAEFSNTGPCTDIYAPGVDVISSYNSGNSAYESLDGTSMATPHVGGMLAYLAKQNAGITPTALKQKLVSSAIAGKLTVGSNPVTPGGQLIIAQNDAAGGSFVRRNW